MQKSRETRFKKSVENLSNRLGRAENFLDSEIISRNEKGMDKLKIKDGYDQGHRSSLPTEIYRDKNTLVEVTVHRNVKNKVNNNISRKEKGQSWADSLSDSDIKFNKATKSSLAKVKKSPRKDNTRSKEEMKENIKSVSKKYDEDKNMENILADLRDILRVSGVDNIQDFVKKIDGKNSDRDVAKTENSCSNSNLVQQRDLELKLEKLKVENEKIKAECSRYKHEYGVLVKQVDISKDSVNSLETQVADLKKIISRLTKNNGELLDIVKEKIKYEDIIAELEKKENFLNDELVKERSHSDQLQKRLRSAQSENENLRLLSADLRAHLRSGLSGLQASRPTSVPSIENVVPPLGDVTKMILGVKPKDGQDATDDENDSAYDDPNTESLKSRPKSSRQDILKKPQVEVSPPTKIPSHDHVSDRVDGVSQLRADRKSKSPVRNLFPVDPQSGRTQSRSSTLVDMESIHEDKSPSFQQLPLDLSETKSEIGDVEAGDQAKKNLEVSRSSSIKLSLEDKVSDFLARLQNDSQSLDIDIPKPRPFAGGSFHLSLSNSDIDASSSRVEDTYDTTLTEGKFLRGLETSIEVLQNNTQNTLQQ